MYNYIYLDVYTLIHKTQTFYVRGKLKYFTIHVYVPFLRWEDAVFTCQSVKEEQTWLPFKTFLICGYV